MGYKQRCLIAGVVFAAASFAPPAGAGWGKQIDGDWCYSDGRHVAIDGSQIVTPAGTLLIGYYSSHSFHYVVPEDEPNAGARIHIFQLTNETISVRVGPNIAGVVIQEWQRCNRLAV